MRQDPPYPPPPWRLRGHGLLCLGLLDAAVAQRQVPPPLKILRLLPGRTPATLYVARYDAGSALEYSELIIAHAATRRGMRVGAWLSQLWVDDPSAVAGGHGIWSLPKQLARFEWSARAVRVWTDGRLLCEVAWTTAKFGLPLPLLAPVTSMRGSSPRDFLVTGTAFVSRTQARVSWSGESGLPTCNFSGGALRLARLRLRVGPLAAG